MSHRTDRSNRNLLGWAFVAVFAAVFLPMSPMAEDAAENRAVVLKHDDGTSDGKQSYGGAGHAIRFECPTENGMLTGISLYGSRYGDPDPPNEDFTIRVVGDFGEYGLAVQTAIGKPYSSFERGDPEWVDLEFAPVKVPKTFWVFIDFHAHQTKGVYLHYDTSGQESFSKKVLPDGKSFHLEEIDKTWNWMIRAKLLPGKASADEGAPEKRTPEVVSISPPNGAEDVDPNLSELRVEFNVPMAGGFSWCGGGEHFPEISEGKKPYWSEDKKTCFLPVKLKPNWEYHLGINCPSFRNFRSAGGIPVEPQPYSFKTAGSE